MASHVTERRNAYRRARVKYSKALADDRKSLADLLKARTFLDSALAAYQEAKRSRSVELGGGSWSKGRG